LPQAHTEPSFWTATVKTSLRLPLTKRSNIPW